MGTASSPMASDLTKSRRSRASTSAGSAGSSELIYKTQSSMEKKAGDSQRSRSPDIADDEVCGTRSKRMSMGPIMTSLVSTRQRPAQTVKPRLHGRSTYASGRISFASDLGEPDTSMPKEPDEASCSSDA